MLEAGVHTLEELFSRLEGDPEEQRALSRIFTVTISRFFRDKDVFDWLGSAMIPSLLQRRKEGRLQVWSIGCASGEEPYSISLLWKEMFENNDPQIDLSVVTTDIDEMLLERAKKGRYKKSSLEEVPPQILQKHFTPEGGWYVLDKTIRQQIEFKRHDLMREGPLSGMDIVFCRNLAFTYFSKESQAGAMRKISASLADSGFLVIGKNERLPLHYPALFVSAFGPSIYQKFGPLKAGIPEG